MLQFLFDAFLRTGSYRGGHPEIIAMSFLGAHLIENPT